MVRLLYLYESRSIRRKQQASASVAGSQGARSASGYLGTLKNKLNVTSLQSIDGSSLIAGMGIVFLA